MAQVDDLDELIACARRVEASPLLVGEQVVAVCSLRREPNSGSPLRPLWPIPYCWTRRRHWSSVAGQADHMEIGRRRLDRHTLRDVKPEDLIPIVVALVAAGVSMVSVIISFLARLDSKRSADASVRSSEAAARSAKAAEGTLGIESDRRAEELSASRQAAEDSRSARLDAVLTSAKELAIVNTGKCRAQNVALKLENDESDTSTLPMVLFDGTREIGPGLSEVWKLLPHGGTAISYMVRIAWTDQNGDHEVRQRVHA